MKKETSIKLRVAHDEKKLIQTMAGRAGMKLSEYLRKSAVSLHIDAPISPEVVRAISRWSANLNQIAAHANSTGEVDRAEVLALRQEAVKLLQAIGERK